MIHFSDFKVFFGKGGLEKLRVICTHEFRKSYLYVDGKKSSSVSGFSFKGLSKDFGEITFFIPIESISEGSSELKQIEERVVFGESIRFDELPIQLRDIDLSVFNQKLYLKFILDKVEDTNEISNFFERGGL